MNGRHHQSLIEKTRGLTPLRTAVVHPVDALVFTAGIGEHAPEIRRRVCEQAAWLGLQIDDAANAAGGPRISKAGSKASAWMIPTDEDLVIARHTRRLVGAGKA